MVYVSPLITCLTNKNWRWNQVSHMVADTEEELIDFAIKIGFEAKWRWIQRKTIVHFDLTKSKQAKAIKNGAKLQTMKEHVIWIRKYRIK